MQFVLKITCIDGFTFFGILTIDLFFPFLFNVAFKVR